MDIKVKMNGRIFSAELFDTESGKAFHALLPLSFEMEDTDGCMKTRYLSKKLPVNAESCTPAAGDIILIGASCLNIVYEDIGVAKNCTRIGRIEESGDLAPAAGRKDADVTFSA